MVLPENIYDKNKSSKDKTSEKDQYCKMDNKYSEKVFSEHWEDNTRIGSRSQGQSMF